MQHGLQYSEGDIIMDVGANVGGSSCSCCSLYRPLQIDIEMHSTAELMPKILS